MANGESEAVKREMHQPAREKRKLASLKMKASRNIS